jgi:hypothetical protein
VQQYFDVLLLLEKVAETVVLGDVSLQCMLDIICDDEVLPCKNCMKLNTEIHNVMLEVSLS